MALPADIRARIDSDFRSQDRDAAVDLLEAHSGQGERVLRCIVHLSGGSFSKLEHFVEQARMDYRDVILWAEYDHGNQRVRDFTRGFDHV